MNNLSAARIVVKAFRLLSKETVVKARNGDNEAAKEVLSQMTAENIALKNLGYALTDNGRLVKYSRRTRDPLNELALRASGGDVAAAMELLHAMSAPVGMGGTPQR
jgi:hypothetical protein